ncbi:MAG: hypothetical protein GC136_01150 [Alphaproteobacteria bacterium]|nr:hypothetical protein [Alphaproteobacteria bacterium]
MKPVFLHGLWRSGSTYVWSRFRVLSQTYCFYEPLNQGLGRLTLDRIGRDTEERTENNHHPHMHQPYFAEFAPLVFGRGVINYVRHLAYDDYALKPKQSHTKLKNYIEGLLEYTKRLGKVPVLGFNRSGLRIAWLKKNFNSCDIYIDRDPIDIWHSYEQQRNNGNDTFYTAWFETLERNKNNKTLGPLARYIGVRGPLLQFFTRTKKYYKKHAEKLGPEKRYQLVVYMWAVCLLEGLRYSDIIIDMTQADDAAYIKQAINSINEATGLEPNFSDIKSIRQPPASLLLRHEALENEVFALLPENSDKTLPEKSTLLTPRKQNMLKIALRL